MSAKRADILETALTLFATHGYHGVGVDRIKDQAGVSKMTLYKYFPTKDALIEGVLELRDTRLRASLEAAVAAVEGGRERIRAVFDWHERWFRQPDFHGCLFIKAADEFPQADAAVRQLSRVHKNHVRALLHAILEAAGARAPEALAGMLLVILDGLIVNANLFNDPSCVPASWPYIEGLLAHDLP